MGFPTIDFGAGTDGAFSHPTDHIAIDTISSKNIRLNSQTFTTAASIVAVQIKPRYGVNMTDNIYGLEVEPGCSTGSVFTGKGITGIASRPRMRGGNLSGDVLAFEAKLEYGDSGKTVALASAALKCILSSKRTFTQGVFPIYVAAKEDTTDWTAFALIPDDGVIGSDSGTITLNSNGWIKIMVGTAASQAARYIPMGTKD